MNKIIWLVLAALLLFVPMTQAAVATFDDLTLGAESSWHGNDDGTGYGTKSRFTSGDNSFVNYDCANPGWTYWDGFAYSNTTDKVTAGPGNQFSAITGGGVNGSVNYAVSYTFGMSGQRAQTHNNADASGSKAREISGFYASNTTWAYQSMTNGDGFAKVFGGEDGSDADWFKLTIHALNEGNNKTGAFVDFYLADLRFEDSTRDYILDEWSWVDLSGLGEVAGLEFELTSSDSSGGLYGMKTPAYFAMDNFNGAAPVPVPAAVWLLGSGIIGLAGLRKKGM
ncbi:MAG: DUF4465 domain-containing protein [Desulfobacterium sp.]|nr:DUF4465 domain-containing protein [Desulfobacterium sp.]